MSMLMNLLLATLSVFITAYVLPGVKLEGWTAALILAVVLGIINTVIRPVLIVLTLPINIMTLGLFTLVIMAVCVLLASAIVPGFHVDGFFWAMAFSIVLFVVKKFLLPMAA